MSYERIKYGGKISGSLQVSNDLVVTGSVVGTASYAIDSPYSASIASRASLLEIISGSHTTQLANLETASGSFSIRVTNLVSDSSSFSTRVTNLVSDSSSFSDRLTSFTGSVFGTASWAIQSQTASYVLNSVSSSYALTASYASNVPATSSWSIQAQTASFVSTLNQAVIISGSLVLTGSISLNSGNTGSTVLDISAGTFEFTGSMLVSGSMVMTGSIDVSGGFTGSLLGTASYAALANTASFVSLAQTASYVTLAQSSSVSEYSKTASYVLNAVSASYITNAQTASYVTLAQTASFVTLAQTASFVTLAQSASVSEFSKTASYVLNAITASYVSNAQSASYVTLSQTASFVTLSQTASFVILAQTASFVQQAVSSSFSTTSSNVSYNNVSGISSTSTFAGTASFASSANSSSTAISSSYALTSTSASYALNATNAVSSSFSQFAVTASYASNALLPNGVVSSSAQLSNGGGTAFTNSNSITVGQLTASNANIVNLTVQFITSSVIFSSGSNKFGNLVTDTQQFTGSVEISGSFKITGSMSGNLTGTASFATTYADSGSVASRLTNLVSDSGSFSTRVTNLVTDSSSFSTRVTNLVSDSGSFSTRITTDSGSFSTRVTNLVTDSSSFSTRVSNLVTDSSSFSTRVTNLVSDSGSFSTRVTNLVADSSSFSNRLTNFTGSVFGTASWAIQASTASFVQNAISASFALTASFASNVPATSSFAISASYALTASFASNVPATSSFAIFAETASYVLNAVSSSFALTASFASNVPATASFAIFAQTASLAQTASYLLGNASASYIQFSQPSSITTEVAKLQWDSGSGTFEFGVGSGTAISSRISQDMFSIVRNVDTTTIAKGNVVYLFGASGDKPSVKKASNLSDVTSAKTFGIAHENILVNAFGIVTTTGIITGLNLAAFTAGDILYLGTATGSLTNIKPQAPLHTVFLGVVNRANAGNGIMYINPQNGYELDELHDVRIISSSAGQALIYSGSYWINSNELNITGSVLGTASWAAQSQTASYAITSSNSDLAKTASFVTLSQTASYITTAQSASYVLLAKSASYVLNAVSASYSTTASYALNALSASYAPNTYVLPSNVVSASAQLSNGGGTSFTNSNNITVGQVTASAISVTTLSVVTITSSIDYASGSNIFGTKSTDKQLFTGSVSMSGSLSVVGNITSNNVLSISAGTVALPSLILSTDTTSGMYRIGANNIGVAISGAKVLDISSTGLSVTGALSATGNVSSSNASLIAKGGTSAGADQVSLDQQPGYGRMLACGTNASTYGTIQLAVASSNASLYTSIVGISSTGLAVTGALSATGAIGCLGLTSTNGNIIITGNDQSINRLRFVNTGAGGENWNIIGGQPNVDNTGLSFHYNPSGNAIMVLKITGLAVTGALSSTTGANFATSSGNVGIGTASPGNVLEIFRTAATNATLQPLLTLNSNFGSATTTGFGGALVFRGTAAGGPTFDMAQIAAFNEDANDNGFALGFFTKPNASFGPLERIRILRNGNVVIGTTSSYAKLAIVSLSSTAYGLISQTPIVGLTAGNYVNMAYFTDARSSNSDGLRIVNVRDTTDSSSANWQTSSFRIRRSLDQNEGTSGVQEEIVWGNYLLGFNVDGSERGRFTSAGLAVTGTLTSSTGFGCNGNAAQTKAVSGGTLAGVIAALVANGILSS